MHVRRIAPMLTSPYLFWRYHLLIQSASPRVMPNPTPSTPFVFCERRSENILSPQDLRGALVLAPKGCTVVGRFRPQRFVGGLFYTASVAVCFLCSLADCPLPIHPPPLLRAHCLREPASSRLEHLFMSLFLILGALVGVVSFLLAPAADGVGRRRPSGAGVLQPRLRRARPSARQEPPGIAAGDGRRRRSLMTFLFKCVLWPFFFIFLPLLSRCVHNNPRRWGGWRPHGGVIVGSMVDARQMFALVHVRWT